MLKDDFEKIKNYMELCMKDSAHDQEHVFRVLSIALDIAATEESTEKDILIAACLLHDIGRAEEMEDLAKDHALVGGEKAYNFLLENGWQKEFAQKVRQCIETHRFRADRFPASLEAKILFDADKVDVTGAMGICRTLLYEGKMGTPLYTRDEEGEILLSGERASFLAEYERKLKTIYDVFYTSRGRKLALQRQKAAAAFYNSLKDEILSMDQRGKEFLKLYDFWKCGEEK